MGVAALLRRGLRMAPLLAAWSIMGAEPSSAGDCLPTGPCTLYVRDGFVADPDAACPGRSPETAFARIGDAAAALVNPGEIVCVGPGTYEESNITPSRGGTESRPIHFFADSTGTLTGGAAGEVKLVSPLPTPCSPDADAGFRLTGFRDVIIEGFAIEGFCDAGVQVRSSNPADRNPINSSRITIRGNVIRGTGKPGIDVWAEGLIVVEGNVLTGNGESGLSLQSCGEGTPPEEQTVGRCRAGPSGPVEPIVSNNVVGDNGAHGIFVRDADGGTIQNNQLFRNAATGISMRGAADFLLINNLIYRNSEEGVAVGRGGMAAPNVIVVNNTFFENGEWGVEIGDPGGPSPGALVINNIFDGNGGREVNGRGRLGIGVLNESVERLGGIRSTCGYVAGFNLMSDDYGPKTPGNVYDIQLFPDTGHTPRFADPENGDFRLLPGSPAIDAGSTSIAAIGLTGSATADGLPDRGRVDIGFHDGADAAQMIAVPAPFMPVYVRPTGSDTNGGKQPSDAFRTITTAARRARAGVTVIVAPGTYRECDLGPPPDNGKASFVGDPLGIRTGAAPGTVLIDAGCCRRDESNACVRGETAFNLPSACFAVVDGFHMRGARDDGIQVQTGSHFAEVRNNVSFSNLFRGINVINAHDVRIVNNLVYANRSMNNQGATLGGGIQIGGTCSPSDDCTKAGSLRAWIQNNTAYGNGVNGITIGTGQGSSSEATARYNILHSNGENGLQLSGAAQAEAAGFAERSGLNLYFGNQRQPYVPLAAASVSDLRLDPLLVDPSGPDGILGGTGFADDNFCLSQQAAGQGATSLAVDYGDVEVGEAGVAGRSTRTDRVPDVDLVDLGYHSPALRFEPAGDCNDDGVVSLEEVVRAVNIALGVVPLSACPDADVNGDGMVGVDDLLLMVTSALAAGF